LVVEEAVAGAQARVAPGEAGELEAGVEPVVAAPAERELEQAVEEEQARAGREVEAVVVPEVEVRAEVVSEAVLVALEAEVVAAVLDLAEEEEQVRAGREAARALEVADLAEGVAGPEVEDRAEVVSVAVLVALEAEVGAAVLDLAEEAGQV
jgi:hypothetical protein